MVVLQFDGFCQKARRTLPSPFPIPSSPSQWGQRFYVDLDSDSHFDKPFKDSDSSSNKDNNHSYYDTNNTSFDSDHSGANSPEQVRLLRSPSKRSIELYPSVHTSTQSIGIYLLQGLDGSERLTAQKCLSVHKLLRNKIRKSISEEQESFRNSFRMGVTNQEFDVEMDANLSK